ncbi:MAG: LysM domain-containing protein, partial [Actinobacteria bacterium ATB1]|nr:LysM domain-containing protein [Actinobacteria bacterium ATB1]
MQKWSRSSARPRALAALSFTIVLLTLWVAFPADAAGTYKVKQGDTIQGIAQRHGVSWKALADANGLRPPYTIVVGRTLQIPGSGASASSSAASGSGGRIGPG